MYIIVIEINLSTNTLVSEDQYFEVTLLLGLVIIFLLLNDTSKYKYIFIYYINNYL
jgi:hypothetical protein